MKYVCMTSAEYGEEIFTFPIKVPHDVFAEALTDVRSQSFGNWERIHRRPVSAGFISRNETCVGYSSSLRLDSRGDKDTEIYREQMNGRSFGPPKTHVKFLKGEIP